MITIADFRLQLVNRGTHFVNKYIKKEANAAIASTSNLIIHIRRKVCKSCVNHGLHMTKTVATQDFSGISCDYAVADKQNSGHFSFPPLFFSTSITGIFFCVEYRFPPYLRMNSSCFVCFSGKAAYGIWRRLLGKTPRQYEYISHRHSAAVAVPAADRSSELSDCRTMADGGNSFPVHYPLQ